MMICRRKSHCQTVDLHTLYLFTVLLNVRIFSRLKWKAAVLFLWGLKWERERHARGWQTILATALDRLHQDMEKHTPVELCMETDTQAKAKNGATPHNITVLCKLEEVKGGLSTLGGFPVENLTLILAMRASVEAASSSICLLISGLPSLSPFTASLNFSILFLKFFTFTRPSTLPCKRNNAIYLLVQSIDLFKTAYFVHLVSDWNVCIVNIKGAIE